MTYNVFGGMLNLAQSNPNPITNWFMYAYSLSPVCLFYVHTYIYNSALCWWWWWWLWNRTVEITELL